jgi:hypothetical protein
MAWSPPALSARIVWVSAPGDYATFNSNHTPDRTGISAAPPLGNSHLAAVGKIGLPLGDCNRGTALGPKG